MLANLCGICIFYMVATHRLQKRSKEVTIKFGVQSQCDLAYANMVTKEYKQACSYEFLKIRKVIWKFQFAFLTLGACIGFGTTILHKLRQKNEISATPDKEYCDMLDKIIFYFFFSGIYKDPRASQQNFFYLTFAIIGFGLVFERQCINWLSNRQGCNYTRLQKFIELEIRYRALKDGWALNSIKYNIDAYEDNYFYHDFEYVKSRIQESADEITERRKAMKKEQVFENRDFVPYSVAQRLRNTIEFTLKLAARADELNISAQDEHYLEHIEQERLVFYAKHDHGSLTSTQKLKNLARR